MTSVKFHRRQFLSLAASAALAPGFPRVAAAHTYPARPVRIVVPFTPAGGTDIFARLVGQWLSEQLGQQFIIDNRPGAGANIGTEAVVRSPADGHTLLLASGANAINATLYEKLNFDFMRDITPVAGIVRVPLIMMVSPSFPAKTIPEFIDYAKANPGKISMASAGIGSTPHVAGELFKTMAGIDMVHVPYRGGGPALTDLLAGQVQVYFPGSSGSVEYVKAGKLRALAVTTDSRSEALPDTPALGEFLPGYEASQWYGIGAPTNTPREIVSMLNRQINAALADPKIRKRFDDLAITALTGPSADFGKLIADETEKWARVVRTANIRL